MHSNKSRTLFVFSVAFLFHWIHSKKQQTVQWAKCKDWNYKRICNESNNIEFCITIHLVRIYGSLEFYSLLQAGRSSATHFSIFSNTEQFVAPLRVFEPGYDLTVHCTLRNVWVANSSLYNLHCCVYWHILSLSLRLATNILDDNMSGCHVPAYRRNFTLWICKKVNMKILRRSYSDLLLFAVVRYALSTVFLKALVYSFPNFSRIRLEAI